MMRSLTAAAILAGIGFLGAGAARAADPFVVTSTTFKDGEKLPLKMVGAPARGGNCIGENVSPQLSWSGIPDGTKSLALTLVDPEGRGGTGVHHFLAYGIDPNTVKSFAEGELSKASDKYVGGKSMMNVGHYEGPCAGFGPPHHYTFMLIATDYDPKDLPPGLTIPELWAKLQGHTKGATGLVGLYSKPTP
jgi:Raf kinase inhibitor-like YbhB/YbcL family protein